MRATAPPTLPMPTRPRVLPSSSEPEKLFLSQAPAFMEASARGISRARANIRPTASSAAASALPPGVFSTRIRRSVAAFTSMLSTPAPARPITFSDFPASIICRLACVAERTTSPTASPTAAARSAGGSPVFTTSSSSGNRPNSSIPSFAIESATNTFIFAMGQGVAPGGHLCKPSRPGPQPRRARGVPRTSGSAPAKRV